MDMKTSNYSLDIILEIVEDAPEMAIVFFAVITEEMEGRTFRNFEMLQVTIDGEDIDFAPHEDDIMLAIKSQEDKWVREYD